MKTSPKSRSRKPADEETPSTDPRGAEPVTVPSFPVVGIGASAGGLETLATFFDNVPAESGMAFVVVQHLDPTREGMMAELLQRSTAMPVAQVDDRMAVRPNRVYVIPPNRDMSILHGVLHLLEPAAPRGLRLPIDFFFRSLADDQADRAIGVILSGMGSDGALGLRAIKEKAGVVFVQDPATAKFDGMPRSAVDAGLADVVALAEELPDRIAAYLRHLPTRATDPAVDEAAQSAMEKVAILLRAQTGHDFSGYKRSTFYRRIERRMGIHQIDKAASYVRYLRENAQEAELLFRELLIGVTSFFRDPPTWECLRETVFPSLLQGPHGGELRAWVPGCATGEEAYSLAIVFKEALDKLHPACNWSLQIFATDLDQHAIDRAREAVFPANIAADVSPERLSRYFLQVERGYQVAKPIREMVIFAPQNLIMDPPFTKLDVVTCRNLLIYLSPELQKKLVPLFHYSLNPGGWLVLGSAETIGGYSDLFATADAKQRIYRRQESSRCVASLDFPTAFAGAASTGMQRAPAKPTANVQALTEQVLLRSYAPAAVLVNAEGDIIYINGRTGKYLEPAAGKANWNLFAMAREGLQVKLRAAFKRAVHQGRTVTTRRLTVGTNGGTQCVEATIQPLTAPDTLRGMVLVVFTDLPAPPPAPRTSKLAHDPRLEELQREADELRLELRTAREEMQTSQEELRSANEELQSTNEELQSTNEELTTSKEEMQSLNEELQTLNHELQAKVDELSLTSSDMKNLLDSTDIATLFLDDALCVRRFTSQAARIIKLIPSDVGRPVTDIATDLDYPGFADDVREVLRTLVYQESEAPTGDGRCFRVRIMPYRTLDNKIDGVVVTFTNLTEVKQIEASLRDALAGEKDHA